MFPLVFSWPYLNKPPPFACVTCTLCLVLFCLISCSEKYQRAKNLSSEKLTRCRMRDQSFCLCLLGSSPHLSLYQLCAAWQMNRDRQSWFSAGNLAPLMPAFVGHGVWVGVSGEPGASRWEGRMREAIYFSADWFPAGRHRLTEITGSSTVK